VQSLVFYSSATNVHVNITHNIVNEFWALCDITVSMQEPSCSVAFHSTVTCQHPRPLQGGGGLLWNCSHGSILLGNSLYRFVHILQLFHRTQHCLTICYCFTKLNKILAVSICRAIDVKLLPAQKQCNVFNTHAD
jgi:hypothetical protein